MLPKRNMSLQRGLEQVDQTLAMAPANEASPRNPLSGESAAAECLSLRQLAHELNSLLDGSLRHLGLALGQLEQAVGDGAAEVSASTAQVSETISIAREAMWQMAQLLEQVIRGDGGPARVLCRTQTIDQEVRRICGLLGALAAAHGIQLVQTIDPEVRCLPIGPLGTIISNGLRNAIQACARGPQGGRNKERSGRVELTVKRAEPGTLVIQILDTGPGLPADSEAAPAGHGVGVALSRQVIEELGGRLEFSAAPGGHGTRFYVQVPIERLMDECRQPAPEF